MQTRKNRKNEEQSYEKMLILKRDLCKAQQILKLIKKRENLKKEFLKLTLETFEKRLVFPFIFLKKIIEHIL
jgi:enhancer of polycomb-like protein